MMLVKILASWRENLKGWCGWALLVGYVLITLAAVVPYGSKIQSVTVVSVGLDKIAHFIGFACMGLFALGAGIGSPPWKRSLLVFLVLAFGVVIEVVQYYLPYRTFNPVDIFANVCGVGVAFVCWKMVNGS